MKIPRKSAKSGDITGGLPRVTELFEARNPSNPAVVSEIDGVVSFGKIKRGNREIIVESKYGDLKKYLVKLSNQILVQENDFIKAGMPLRWINYTNRYTQHKGSFCCSTILGQ